MTEDFAPAELELMDRIAEALAGDMLLEPVAGGTKSGLGRPVSAAALNLAGLAGISLYEPDELVLTAGAATPLAEIGRALSEQKQCLAFEPPDLGPLLGGDMAAQTIGGIIACNLAGPRRIRAGSARDHFLGVRAISGRGEFFKSGGRVVKNVTGYDMCKLLAGSFGTLAAMTQITIKVLPAPDRTRTLLVYGLADKNAVDAMGEALAGPVDVSAACHLPAPVAATSTVGRIRDPGHAVTAIRLEGPEPSVTARLAALYDLLSPRGKTEELHRHNSEVFWREVGGCSFFAADATVSAAAVWRLSVPPAFGSAVWQDIRGDLDAETFFDWGGGLVWLRTADAGDAGATAIRAAVARHGGHATLIRATKETRERVPVFQPQSEAVAALTRRIKDAFDPRRILNPGRMYADL